MKLHNLRVVETNQHPSGCWHGRAYNSNSDLTPKIAVRCMPTEKSVFDALSAWVKSLSEHDF